MNIKKQIVFTFLISFFLANHISANVLETAAQEQQLPSQADSANILFRIDASRKEADLCFVKKNKKHKDAVWYSYASLTGIPSLAGLCFLGFPKPPQKKNLPILGLGFAILCGLRALYLEYWVSRNYAQEQLRNEKEAADLEKTLKNQTTLQGTSS